MLKPGLVSVTFRQFEPHRIIELAKTANLTGIEWGADVHVPPGQIDNACRVRDWMETADLETVAYGSYYLVGSGRQDSARFETILETAQALGTGMVRVWAGDRNSEDADASYRQSVIDDTCRIADLAAAKGIQIAYEYHDETLTNTADSCRALLEAVNRPNILTYWQPMRGMDTARNCTDIELLRPWIAGVHVFYWDSFHTTRYLLKDAKDVWEDYFSRLDTCERVLYGMLEFVKDDKTESFGEDARTLLELLGAR